MGRPVKNRRVGFAIQRAHFVDLLMRALSAEMPVLAYICRYNFETSTNATRDFSDFTHLARSQIFWWA